MNILKYNNPLVVHTLTKKKDVLKHLNNHTFKKKCKQLIYRGSHNNQHLAPCLVFCLLFTIGDSFILVTQPVMIAEAWRSIQIMFWVKWIQTRGRPRLRWTDGTLWYYSMVTGKVYLQLLLHHLSSASQIMKSYQNSHMYSAMSRTMTTTTTQIFLAPMRAVS